LAILCKLFEIFDVVQVAMIWQPNYAIMHLLFILGGILERASKEDI